MNESLRGVLFGCACDGRINVFELCGSSDALLYLTLSYKLRLYAAFLGLC